MRLSRRIIFPIFVIILLSLACSIPSSSTPSPKSIEDQIATAASGTLTAMAPTETELPPEETVEPATATPSPAYFPDDTSEPPEVMRPAELRLAYSNQDGNLWVWAEGSGPVNLLSSGDVSNAVISPDGEWITFTRTAADFIDTSIWAIRFNGMDEHLLVDHEEFMAMPLHPGISAADVITVTPWMMQFVPGTRTLAFMTYPQFEGPGFFDNKDLWLVDVENGRRTSLLAAGQGGQYYYSPDGSQIALVTATDISLINADGSNRRSNILIYPNVYTYSEYEFHAFPQWAPDGSFLRVIIPPQDSLGDLSALSNIYQLPIDGSPAIFLGSLHLAPLEYGQFSPDLNRIAFIQQIGAPEDNLFSLNFSNFDGGGMLEVTRGGLDFVAWSPDSNRFAYVNWSPRAMYLGQVGSAGTTLVDANPAGNLRWISNERFFFFYQVSPEWQLRLGSLGAPSSVIANLGSGTHSPSYDFVTP